MARALVPTAAVRRARIGRRWAKPALVAALFLIAVAVRGPYLWDIPRFTDETAEAEIGLQIARGQGLPLTNRDPYIGSLWNWLLAAGFAVSGPSLFTPRALILVLGAMTIVPTATGVGEPGADFNVVIFPDNLRAGSTLVAVETRSPNLPL